MSKESSTLIPKLYNFLSVQDIDEAKVYFKSFGADGLNYEHLREYLTRFGIVYKTDSVYENVCLRIDMDRDCRIKFNEFIAYFITELQNDDNAAERLSITPPIAKSTKVLSTIARNRILRIFYVPSTIADKSSESIMNECYITIGCYGDVYVWSLKWKLNKIIHVDTILDTTSPTVELSDKRKIKKSSKTLILDAIILTNMNIICVSSVCCDLRFYDTSNTDKCNLRLYIRNFPSPLNAFYYYLNESISNNESSNDGDDDKDIVSRLIFGDSVGSVRVIDFTKNFKTNFRMGSMIRQISYSELMKGHYGTVKCFEFVNLHSDIIRQVCYSKSINSLISASESTMTTNSYLPGVIITHLGIQQSQIVFKMNSLLSMPDNLPIIHSKTLASVYINQGTTCFAFDESSQTLATGGPDCILRLWNLTMPSSPKAIFGGHLSEIVDIFIQDGVKVYSIDKNKFIKIWDIEEQNLKQTFTGLKPIFPDDLPIITFYNDSKRELIAAAKKISITECSPRICPDKSDGNTHIAPITVILFNELFQFLVSCSSDSTIIVWDLWRGRKVNWIIRAHTVVRHGEVVPIAITAGCFDTKHQYLLTGGANGSLKIWNFNEGFCVRTLYVSGLIRAVFWTDNRIFAIGDFVTEFHDSKDYKEQINIGKIWQNCHDNGKIACATMRYPDALVTACSHGDVIWWHYETGHPYMKFNVNKPTQRMQIVYHKNDDENFSRVTRLQSRMDESIKSPICMISLNKRPVDVSNGTLLVSLSNGEIQVWSHHHKSEHFIADFNAIHVAGDVITSMTTDSKNCYLFSGSSLGYIKVWMLVNFCQSTSIESSPSQLELNIRFPFLWRDGIEGRAKRTVKNQFAPLLLSSYQGHKGASITGLIYSEKNQILISSSSDKSVRLWNVSGQYINTIGGHMKWQMLSPNEPLPPDFTYNFPADLKNVISYTTLKVLEGGNIPTLMTRNISELRKLEKEMASGEDAIADENLSSDEISDAKSYQRIINRPVVRKEDEEKKKERLLYEKPSLDISLPHIPIYRHLRIHRTVPINLPRTIPKCLETSNLPNLQNISHLEPEDMKK